jgi:hypothetical protein
MVLDQFLNPARVALGVSVADQRVAPTRGFDEDFRPDHPGLDVDRSDLGKAHADLVRTEPSALAPHHGPVADLDDGWENEVSVGPTAGLKSFGFHMLRSDALMGRLEVQVNRELRQFWPTERSKRLHPRWNAATVTFCWSSVWAQIQGSTGARHH